MGQRKFAAYRIIKKLWSRADGMVCFLASLSGFDRKVELRLIGSGVNTGSPFVKRFVQEFKVLARLDHPLDMGCAEGKIYYTRDRDERTQSAAAFIRALEPFYRSAREEGA